jgi:hypothetical protein
MSFATDMLAKIEAELLRRGDASFPESFSDGSGVQFQGISTTELEDLRDKYRWQAAAEQSKGGNFAQAGFSV